MTANSCPHCLSSTNDGAKKCPHCGEWLSGHKAAPSVADWLVKLAPYSTIVSAVIIGVFSLFVTGKYNQGQLNLKEQEIRNVDVSRQAQVSATLVDDLTDTNPSIRSWARTIVRSLDNKYFLEELQSYSKADQKLINEMQSSGGSREKLAKLAKEYGWDKATKEDRKYWSEQRLYLWAKLPNLQGDSAQALLRAEELVSINPNSPQFAYALGLANFMSDDRMKAIQNWRLAVSLNEKELLLDADLPYFIDAYNNLAWALQLESSTATNPQDIQDMLLEAEKLCKIAVDADESRAKNKQVKLDSDILDTLGQIYKGLATSNANNANKFQRYTREALQIFIKAEESAISPIDKSQFAAEIRDLNNLLRP